MRMRARNGQSHRGGDVLLPLQILRLCFISRVVWQPAEDVVSAGTLDRSEEVCILFAEHRGASKIKQHNCHPHLRLVLL